MMADRRRSARRASRPLGRRQAVPTRADRSRDRFPALRGVRVRIPRDGMSRKTSADKRRRTRHPRDALAGSPCPFRKTCSRRHPLRFQRRGKPPPPGVGRPASMPRFGELARENHVVSCDSLGTSGGSASAGGRGPYLPATASEATEPGRPDLDGSSTGRRSRESGDAPQDLAAISERGDGSPWNARVRTARRRPNIAFVGERGAARFRWSGRRDSNPRPQPWQGCASAFYAPARAIGHHSKSCRYKHLSVSLIRNRHQRFASAC